MMENEIDYLNNPWKPVKQSVFQNEEQGNVIDERGFYVAPLLGGSQLAELTELFEQEHNLNADEGGMFYSVYSQKLDYRQRIHNRIGEILKPVLESFLKDYRVLLNSFVVKAPGPKSEFYLHQDTTGLDEFKYSPLNLWIPLTDVNETNGCLGVIPHSHKFFTPYRSISFPAPFDEINSTVKKYLHPIEMKRGEVLVFDNRLAHHSYSNLSGKTRIAVVCGLFPKEAKLTTCFKPKYELGGQVELIEHNDDFLLKNPNFLIDCQLRPKTGDSIGWKDDPYHSISSEDFEALCERHGVMPVSGNTGETTVECNLISEPT